jgi:hypothetical protein
LARSATGTLDRHAVFARWANGTALALKAARAGHPREAAIAAQVLNDPVDPVFR